MTYRALLFSLILSAFPASAVAQRANAGKDIVQTAVSAGTFRNLAAALEAGDLVGVLRSKGPFTVFAPSDEAFAKLPRGTVEQLLAPENRARLVALLKYHVVPGNLDSKGAARVGRATTLQGEQIRFRFVDGQLTAGGAAIVANDVTATNGRIHVIDRVLIPRAFSAAPKLSRRGAMRKLLIDAIEVGVPLFNRGHERECAAIYRMAVFAVVELGAADLLERDRRSLNKALSSDTGDAASNAWALRRAMDQALKGLMGDSSKPNKISRREMDTKDLYRFADPKVGWRSVNDDVMGGISQGRLVHDPESKTAKFIGALSLENNGGFSSIRSRDERLELAGYEGLVLRVRGDGRTYKVRASGKGSRWGGGYQKEFSTRAGEWQEIEVSFADMQFSWRGRKIKTEPLEGRDVRGIGLMIADKNVAPFSLEIDWIKVYRTRPSSSAPGR